MSKKPYVSNAELNRRLQQQKTHLLSNQRLTQPLQYATATLGAVENKAGVLVHNWKSGYKWLSNWAFAGIAYISVYGIPTEIVSLIPEASQAKATALLAVIGFACRFVNQSRAKALPPVVDENDHSA